MNKGKKKFYKTVVVHKSPDDTYSVRLDDKPVLTPLGNRLASVSLPLMQHVEKEWLAQEDTINPDTMPMTQMLNTMIDHIKPNPMQCIDAIMQFFNADLVCYRDDGDFMLSQRQDGIWSPLVEWLEDAHGITLAVTSGIQHVEQSQEATDTLRGLLSTLSVEQLTALQVAVGATGSVVIALAMMEGRLDPENAFLAAELESLYQAEQWGMDDEVRARHDLIRAELSTAKLFAELAEL